MHTWYDAETCFKTFGSEGSLTWSATNKNCSFGFDKEFVCDGLKGGFGVFGSFLVEFAFRHGLADYRFFFPHSLADFLFFVMAAMVGSDFPQLLNNSCVFLHLIHLLKSPGMFHPDAASYNGNPKTPIFGYIWGWNPIVYTRISSQNSAWVFVGGSWVRQMMPWP